MLSASSAVHFQRKSVNIHNTHAWTWLSRAIPNSVKLTINSGSPFHHLHSDWLSYNLTLSPTRSVQHGSFCKSSVTGRSTRRSVTFSPVTDHCEHPLITGRLDNSYSCGGRIIPRGRKSCRIITTPLNVKYGILWFRGKHLSVFCKDRAGGLPQ